MEPRTKNVTEFTYEGFGFPVHLTGDVPVIQVRGVWTLAVPQAEFEEQIALALANAPWRLTGYQLHFLRHFFGLTLKAFGERFGNVSHSCVIQWQGAQSESTTMNWTIEKDIRLAVFKKLRIREFALVYERFTKAFLGEPGLLSLPVPAAA